MIDFAPFDSPIDQLIWHEIADSLCPEDFSNYIQHAPEGAAHIEEALDRLIALDDVDATCANDEARYPVAVAMIQALAESGDAVAQFHMGKVSDRGIGIEVSRERSSAWYRLAILQKEPRSHINLALRLDEEGTPATIAEARRLLTEAFALGEGTGAFHLARMTSRGRGEDGGLPDPVRSFELFHESWEKGCVVAGHWIGYQLQQGNGMRRDKEFGGEWIDRAARAGCIGAIIQCGSDAENGTGCEKNIPAAIDWFRRGAELGDAECQHRLSHLLLKGNGVTKDGAQAVHWLKRAAIRGNADAQRILGLTYLWGIDVIRNVRFGRKWLTRAAEKGDSYAAFHLGRFLQKLDPPDFDAAFQWFEKAAKAGHSESQGVLGLSYWNGQGVVADAHAAFKWIRLCSLQGDPWGHYLLGRMYYSGVDVPVDYLRAVDCFRQSARHGHPAGQAKLGWCYLQGEGVDRDVAEGMLWISRAAEQGDASASTTIGYVLRDGIGVERNAGEASKWFLDAAEKGDARGQYELAMLYAEGVGLERNLAEAKVWMEKASVQGDLDARAWLAESDESQRVQVC